MNYVLKTKDPLNEWNVNLIYYVMEHSQNYCTILINTGCWVLQI
jgi:hypothetical protein